MRDKLETYRSKRDEIKELEYKLEHLTENDNLIDNDVVFDYRSGYPMPRAVVGKDMEKYSRLSTRYMKQIAKLKKECEEVEEYVEDIEDSFTRRLIRMYYIDGMQQKEIARQTHMDRSNVSRKINKFLESKDT